jgi:serine/threonine protein kinase
LKTVCQIGIRLLQILEKLHRIGKIYNDLKLDNILVGDGNGDPSRLSEIRLIDFGLCSDYLDENG